MKKKQEPEYQAIIKFDRNNSTYRPEEVVTGNIMYQKYNGGDFRLDVTSVSIRVFGSLTTQNVTSSKQLEAINSRLTPITFIDITQTDILKNRTLTASDKIPIKFKLEQKDHKFLETYTGVFIHIRYFITVNTRLYNGVLLSQDIPFYIHVAEAGRSAIEGQFQYPKPRRFMLTNEDIAGDVNKIPKFKVKGEIASEICYFTDDFNGYLEVDHADVPIRSIDLQMLRFERIENELGKFGEKKEIQLIQIGDGNVTRNLQIPMHMIFPREFSCPSVKYKQYRIDFEVNLNVTFKDGYKMIVNLPIKIIRS